MPMRAPRVPPRPLILLLAASALAAQAPIQVARPRPADLDLRTADSGRLVPKDSRDPAQQEAARLAWDPLLAPLGEPAGVRVMLPRGEERQALLLAASQALRARRAEVRIYVGFDPGAPPFWDPAAWGAVDGGALLPEDLGVDPATWRLRLAQAQEFFPGRPWWLWLPQDPGAHAGTLLGDGGRLVVPATGPSARLAAELAPELTEVEGGLGDLTLGSRSGESRRWRFEAGAWKAAPLSKDRTVVAVVAQDAYDVGALLAKMRAAQLRDRTALRSLEARVDVDLHLQASQGPGTDLGFTFRSFEQAGETEELLQEEVRFNGVRANITGEVQLPIIEARASIAAPVALSLTERFRYQDGGPGEAPRTRRLRFEPVDPDPTLPQGELVVSEDTGRVLEERSTRSDLPGVIKSERRRLQYGAPVPGLWRVLRAETFERWVTPRGVAQVQRTIAYRDFAPNQSAFEARRAEARASEATMLKQTVDGLRYYTRQDDGTRVIREKAKSAGKALAGLVLVDPGLQWPVTPLGGFAYFDYNAFDRGIQLNFLTAIVFNMAEVAVPRLPGGFDLGLRASAMLLPTTERPVQNGELSEQDGVARQWGRLTVNLGHDLGYGLRAEAEGRFNYDRFSEPREEEYWTPGYVLPPSGWSRELRGELSWQARGFQISGYLGSGRRPSGTYGTPEDPQTIPEGGGFQRWGGAAGYDYKTRWKGWLHAELGAAGGKGFDRFTSLDLGGLGGDVRVAGIRSGAVAADRITYAKAGVVLPSGGNLRLTVTLDHARARALDTGLTHRFTGLGAAGDVPGFWVFTTVRLDLGVGLQSDIPGLRAINGFVALLRVF